MDKFYPIAVIELTGEDAPGYLGIAVDLKGCISHGDTPEEAFTSAREAVLEWLDEAKANNQPIPEPGFSQTAAMRQRQSYEATIKELRELLARVQEDNRKVQSELAQLKALLGDANQECNPQQLWAAHLIGYGFHDKPKMEEVN